MNKKLLYIYACIFPFTILPVQLFDKSIYDIPWLGLIRAKIEGFYLSCAGMGWLLLLNSGIPCFFYIYYCWSWNYPDAPKKYSFLSFWGHRLRIKNLTRNNLLFSMPNKIYRNCISWWEREQKMGISGLRSPLGALKRHNKTSKGLYCWECIIYFILFYFDDSIITME